ncbi:MAG: hydrogenase 3 maturation endopeptidase HyCI [Anaerolineales bacterium]|nr:hydrogenase 3 maturation endopeptidase HyCI [Anaerolineales bacterium]
MSRPSWENSLTQTLKRPPHKPPQRVVILGMGHELRGDDAPGLVIAQHLRPLANDSWLVIEGGHAPENHTSTIRHFQPDFVLFIDAAQMNARPGTIRWLSWPETMGLSASTHTMPPYMLAHYLQQDLGCDIALIGIQPAVNTLDVPLSADVQMAVNTLTKALLQIMTAS